MPDFANYLPSAELKTRNDNHHQLRHKQGTEQNFQQPKRKHSHDQSVQTTAVGEKASPPTLAIEHSQHRQQSCILLLNLPPVVTNSALVRQRVSAKDSLAAATVAAGASLPLMVGAQVPATGTQCSCNPMLAADKQTATQHVNLVPKNTALRAEQRRQNNMVSVVRPVVSSRAVVEQQNPNIHLNNLVNKRLKESSLWNQVQFEADDHKSVIDDFLDLHSQDLREPSTRQRYKPNDGMALDYLQQQQVELVNEQQVRQQMLLLRREQAELDKHLRRQHQFVVSKLEERKMSLRIVQSVWVQRDFRHAIEKLVDLYQQGLVLASADKASTCCLSSTNTPLIVDVIGIMVLRPKLWSLEICQLLLPIIVNDLLMQQKVQQYENYIEVGFKALKLILSDFSSLIITTLDNNKPQTQHSRCPVGGVDLSGEERVARCSECARLLLDARNVLAQRGASFTSSSAMNTGDTDRWKSLYRELDQALGTFSNSLEQRHKSPDSHQLFKRPNQVGTIN